MHNKIDVNVQGVVRKTLAALQQALFWVMSKIFMSPSCCLSVNQTWAP
jgi:hypothetical protein